MSVPNVRKGYMCKKQKLILESHFVVLEQCRFLNTYRFLLAKMIRQEMVTATTISVINESVKPNAVPSITRESGKAGKYT